MRPIVALALWFLLFPSHSAAAQSVGDILQGQLVRYECGDNCYLVILLPNGSELSGLCAADPCELWNEEGVIPSALIGADVTVELGQGLQYDGNGDVVGPFLAFTAITLAR